jgi:hypothetical protein
MKERQHTKGANNKKQTLGYHLEIKEVAKNELCNTM